MKEFVWPVPRAWLRREMILRLAVILAAAFFLGTFLFIALARIAYPYELEWMEGGALDHVARVLARKALYVAPSLDFTPFIYTPFYYWVCAAFAKVFGLRLFSLRLVSLLASMGTLLVIGALTYRNTRSRLGAWIAMGLFAAMFELSGVWFDLARVDSLALMLALLGAWILLRSDRLDARIEVLAGLVLAAAYLTKQSMLVVAVPVALARVVRPGGWRRFCCLLSLVVVVVASTLFLDLRSSHWFAYYVFTLPASHPLEPVFVSGYWRNDLLRPLPFVMLAAAFTVSRPWATGRRLVELALILSCLAESYFSRLHTGGFVNVLMPAFAVLAWQGGVFAAYLTHPDRPAGVRGICLAACLGQFAILWYPSLPYLPTPTDRAVGDAIVAQIAAFPGAVLVPNHPYLARLAGKPAGAHQMAVEDVLRGRNPAIAGALFDDIRRTVRSGRYIAIYLDGSGLWAPAELATMYMSQPSLLVGLPSAFFPKTGSHVRPSELFVRRP